MKRLIATVLTAAAAASIALISAPLASAATGPPAFIQGVARWSMEFSCGDSHFNPADFSAIRMWNTNTVSITLSDDLWFNTAACPTYQADVQQAVTNANAAGLYVILTLQWVNPWPASCHANYLSAGGQYPMPDAASAVPFWRAVARMFSANPMVGFQLYSEPHDVSNYAWRWGGPVYTPGGAGMCAGWYTATGMQNLADVVANNAPGRYVYVSGLGWAHNLTMVKGHPITGAWVRYSVHLYPGPGWNTPAEWNATFGFLGRKVVALEFGTNNTTSCPTAPLRGVMTYLHATTGGMIAWAWDTDACSLIITWNWQPSAYGTPIRRYYVFG